MTALKCKCIEMNLLNLGEYYGHFLFTPLEGGEGATLANMIRRALLSSLFESKITGVRFAGVNDEFSNMQGVREDLLEIILNLKEIIIKNPSYESCYGRIKVYGPAIVTAGSLVLPSGVTVINPRSHILTVCEESLVELEVKIEPGKLYRLPQNRKTEGPGDFLNVDSNFTPVLKVNSYIESIAQDPEPLSQSIKNKNEELHIEIYTNGALLPHQALMIAGNRLASMVLAFQRILFSKKVKTKAKVIDEEKTIVKEPKGKDKTSLKEPKKKEKSISKKNKTLIEQKSTTKYNEPKTNSLLKRFHDEYKDEYTDEFLDDEFNDEDNEALKILRGVESISNNNDTAELIDEILAAEAKEDKKKINCSPVNPAQVKSQKKLEVLKRDTLEGLGLSKRIIKILKKANINNVRELLKCYPEDLEKINGLGAVSIKEINEKKTLFSRP